MRIVDTNIDDEEWDRDLAALGGHPWQSAFWGKAQFEVEGVRDLRLRLRDGSQTLQMVRVEERRLRRLSKLAWIRRGPVSASPTPGSVRLAPEIVTALYEAGFLLAVSNPWRRVPEDGQPLPKNAQRTIWVDLSIGREGLWKGLERNFRNDVGRAERKGIVIETTTDRQLALDYAELYRELGEIKGFSQRMTPEMIVKLVSQAPHEGAEARLFLAKADGEIAAGALICRCGTSIHYMNGASNRKHSKLRPAEALHWAVINWGLSQGCALYDLEGIDPVGNPGVYAFKKKMGGEEVVLAQREVDALNIAGRIVKPIVKYVLNSTHSGFHSFAQGLLRRSA